MRDMVSDDDAVIISANWRNYEVIVKYIESLEMNIKTYDGSLIHAPLQRAICSLKNHKGERIRYEECPYCFMERNYCDLLRENLLLCKISGGQDYNS